MARTYAFRLFVCLFALVPAACGGGGGGSSASVLPAAPASTGTAPASATPAAVTFTVAVPATGTSSASRRTRYVSAATKSVTISYGGVRQTTDCTAACTMTLSVTPGTVTFTATLYDAKAGAGNALASGQTTSTIAPGQANAINLAFGGVVAKVAVALGASTVTAGAPANVAVIVKAQDAAGYTIVGPEPYANPIALSNDDTSGTTALSATSLSAPGDAVTLAYNGTATISAAHIGASVPGTAITAAPATLLVQSAPAAPPAGAVPAHVATWYYYGLNHVNETIPAAWMAAHADYVEDDGFQALHGEAFKDAGGKFAVSYTDPAYVPYCYAPFTPPVKPCDGPIGNHITDESAWFHDATGGRVHHWVDSDFQYQDALNPASQVARDAYTWYTQRLMSRAPKIDYFRADDMGGTYIGPDGTQTSGWFWGYNAAAVEITTDAQFIPAAQQMLAAAARPVFVNGYDPGSRLPAYNGTWLDSPNVAGDEYEGCYGDGPGLAADSTGKWAGQSNGLLMVIAHRSKALCMMTAAPTPSNRIYELASWWMTYTEPYSIAGPELVLPDGYSVAPEFDIVPRQPRATATSDIRALRSAGGAYVREFAACYQVGSAIGPCAAVVNPSAVAVPMPHFTAAYAHALVLDDKSAYTGGQANWSGAIPAQLAPVSAAVLR